MTQYEMDLEQRCAAAIEPEIDRATRRAPFASDCSCMEYKPLPMMERLEGEKYVEKPAMLDQLLIVIMCVTAVFLTAGWVGDLAGVWKH